MNHLDESNFLLFTAKNYDNPNCMDQLEFEEDLNRIKYIKRLFKKYKDKGELKERLILNHLIILYNVFQHEACTKILCFKLNEYIDYLKPFLLYLNYWPTNEEIGSFGFDEKYIYNSDIKMDQYIINVLREL
jgi:hypothetical protein